jgi:tetratricopeptide (TPR) repeat protein
MAELRKARLETWKEVAAFFGKDERTVKRWESERGLPVRRLPGQSRSRIYAEVSELEAWLKGGSLAAVEAPEPAARARPKPWGLALAAAGGLVAIAAVLAVRMGWPIDVRPSRPSPAAPVSAQPPSLAAQKLYLAGMDDWSRRTPDSLHRAVEEFSQAIRLSPRYAEAYAGLANCYNLLREYTQMPASTAYPLARAAAKRALALDDTLASAHVALAFVYSYWDWDLEGAKREYRRAIALDPGSDLNHHWFATFLAARSEFPASLAEFDKAQALNPGSLAIRADHGLVLYEAGRRAEGLALLKTVEKTDSKFLSPHRYLAGLYLLEGRDEDFLREAEITAQLLDDHEKMATVEVARTGLARGGHQGLLRALLDQELRQFKYGAVSAYAVADTYAMIGDTSNALTYLQSAIDRRETDVVSADADLAFARMWGMPGFKALTARIKPASSVL